MDFKQELRKSITREEQRAFVKFSILQDHSTGVIHSNLVKLLGKEALSQSTVKYWAAKFRQGETSSQCAAGGDHSNPEILEQRIEQVKACFDESRHWSLRSLASNCGFSYGTAWKIVKEKLQMTKVLDKWVPHKLSSEQKELRVLCSTLNLRLYSKTPGLLQRILTVDETWVTLYMEPDREQRRNWRYPGEEPEQVAHQNTHQEKRMLIMAMDFNGIAFYELQPPKTTVTGEAYKNFLAKNLDTWRAGHGRGQTWLLHDNARPHQARVVKDFLAEKRIQVLHHPPYSPDLSPLDFCCFAQVKRRLKGTYHQNWGEFEQALRQITYDLTLEGHMKGVQELPLRWQRAIASEGSYF